MKKEKVSLYIKQQNSINMPYLKWCYMAAAHVLIAIVDTEMKNCVIVLYIVPSQR